MNKHIVGVWCGVSSNLMAQVHGVAVLRLTLKRVGPAVCLVPWTSGLDWLEAEIRAWKMHVRRTALDERLAMRDLVIDLGADVGAVVPGDCTSIDRAEVDLAVARIQSGWERYASDRVKCFPRKEWLSVSGTDEWGPYPVTPTDTQKHLSPNQLEARWARVRDSRS